MKLNEKYGWAVLAAWYGVYFTAVFVFSILVGGKVDPLVAWIAICVYGVYFLALIARKIYLAGRNSR